MIRVFIGYDPKEPVAFHVLSHSIMRRASAPVSITPIALSQLEGVMTRERSPIQSTEFSFSRFLVPYLCGFEGWAIFMDCDMLTVGDIAKLWAWRNTNYAVQCVKHDHRPKEKTKFLGQVQTSYPMKNWSSVMLLNNSQCWRLTPDYVNTASGLDLHRFNWLKGPDWEEPIDHRIGALPEEWNYLVGYSGLKCKFPECECSLERDRVNDCPYKARQIIQNYHWTEGGPWFKTYENAPFADLWRRERNDAFGAAK